MRPATMLISLRALGGVLLLAGSLASSFAESSFTSLGGSFWAAAVSGNGKVVVGGSGGQACRWTATGGMVSLGILPGGSSSVATAVSKDGSVVVGSNQSRSGYKPFAQAFRWTAATGMVGLGFLPGGSNSFANAVSGDGKVIVGEGDSTLGWQAFRWTATGGMVGLGYLPGGTNGFGFRYLPDRTDSSAGTISSDKSEEAACYAARPPSSAAAISRDGSVVVGGSVSALGYQAFRWTVKGGMVGLGHLPGATGSEALAVSSDGSVIVGRNDTVSGKCQAFRWTAAEGMVGLGYLPGGSCGSAPSAISSDGSIVIGWNSFVSPPNYRPFIWDKANGMRYLQLVLTKDYHLNLTEWELTAARGISSDEKTIVGDGVHNGRGEVWIAHLDRPVNEAGKKER